MTRTPPIANIATINPRLTVYFDIHGISVPALVDTGAAVTLMTDTTFKRICRQNHRVPFVDTKSKPRLFTVTSQPLQVIGTASIYFQAISKSLPVVILPSESMSHDMILGNDLLERGNSILNHADKTLTWFNTIFHLNRAYSIGNITEIYSNPPIVPPKIAKVKTDFTDIFASSNDAATIANVAPATINTSAPPIAQRAYRPNLIKRELIDAEIDKMLDQGVIQPTASPWASPVVLVPKKDGTTRFCVDYRKLNTVTVKDKYPLPNIRDIFDHLGKASIFSTLDLRSGYWQVPLDEESKAKTAFVCHRGQFMFNVLPFGVVNAPSQYQRLMEKVLTGYIGRFCFVYIDDLIIYSKTEAEHQHHLQLVFQRLREYNLKLKESKCHLGQAQVELLGYVISEKGIHSNPDKINVISQLAAPNNVSEVRRFLGMTGYYRDLIPQYAHIAEPIVKLTKQNYKFIWSPQCQSAFEKLKSALCSNNILAYPESHKPYRLYTDASDTCIGGILVQTDAHGIEKVIHYVSHQLSGAQLRWPTIEQEAYAVIYCLIKLRCYLQGAEFTVLTDHKPLTSLFTAQIKNTKIQRWAVLISEYGCKIEYRKGSNNIRADMLSRLPNNHKACTDDIDKQITELAIIDTNEWVEVDKLHEVEDEDIADGVKDIPLNLCEGMTPDEITRHQQIEFTALMQDARANINDTEYEVINDMLYAVSPPYANAANYPRLVLPSPFWEDAIRQAHNEVGHLGFAATFKRLTDAYVWPGMRAIVRQILSRCATCQVHRQDVARNPMGRMPKSNYPGQLIAMDLVGPLPTAASGNKYLLTVLDHCSGWAEAYPIPNKTAKTVQDAFHTNWLPRFTAPEVLITDNGAEFNAHATREYFRELGIEHRLTSPYHPQSNGKIERFHRTLKQTLGKLSANHPTQWESKLADTLLAYRVAVSCATGFSPFYLMYARQPRLPLTQALFQPEATFESRVLDSAIALRDAARTTEVARDNNKRRLDRKQTTKQVAVGDHVMVKANTRHPLTTRWDPVYIVTRVRGSALLLKHQRSGVIRRANRENVHLVNPDAAWDEVPHRPRHLVNHPQDRPQVLITEPCRDDINVAPQCDNQENAEPLPIQESSDEEMPHDPPELLDDPPPQLPPPRLPQRRDPRQRPKKRQPPVPPLRRDNHKNRRREPPPSQTAKIQSDRMDDTPRAPTPDREVIPMATASSTPDIANTRQWDQVRPSGSGLKLTFSRYKHATKKSVPDTTRTTVDKRLPDPADYDQVRPTGSGLRVRFSRQDAAPEKRKRVAVVDYKRTAPQKENVDKENKEFPQQKTSDNTAYRDAVLRGREILRKRQNRLASDNNSRTSLLSQAGLHIIKC